MPGRQRSRCPEVQGSRFHWMRWSGIGQTQSGPYGKITGLGTFMAAEDKHFSSETVRDMQVALDLAWSSLSPEEQSQSSKTVLATRILSAAEAGERSPARLLLLALTSARPLSSCYSKTADSL